MIKVVVFDYDGTLVRSMGVHVKAWTHVAKLLDAKMREESKKIGDERRAQIGTGDRSEKIRTYNFPQDRVTDHRIKQSWHNIESILAGNIEPLVAALQKS